jgi:hypothetical protein
MKKSLIIKNLLFLLVLTFIVSCSKKTDEVSPATLTGEWKQNGIVGKISYTDNGKAVTEDLSEPADDSIIEFNANGTTVDYFGTTLNYKISGSIITFSGSNGVSFDRTIAKNSATQLTLSYTKDQYYKLLDIAYANKKTDPTYVSLKGILPTITVFQFDESFVKQ